MVSPNGIRAGLAGGLLVGVGTGQCVYACHRALESSMAQTDASDFYNIDCIVQGVIVIVSSNLISSLENYTSRMALPDFVTVTFNLLFVPL